MRCLRIGFYIFLYNTPPLGFNLSIHRVSTFVYLPITSIYFFKNSSIFGASNMISKNVPDNEIWAGTRARFI